MRVCERFDSLGSDDPEHLYRLGIMGGTFDPIHNGHLVCAEEARETFGLDAVIFVPAGRPVRKLGSFVASSEDRLSMARLATASNAAFDVSRIEIDREGVTYTVDTLRALRAIYPSNVEIYFITGADAIWDILTWKGTEELSHLARFVGATRPGYDLQQARDAHAAAAVDFDIAYMEIPALAISSSGLRAKVARGESIRYLTPDPVVDYIAARNLYREEDLSQHGVPASGKGLPQHGMPASGKESPQHGVPASGEESPQHGVPASGKELPQHGVPASGKDILEGKM